MRFKRFKPDSPNCLQCGLTDDRFHFSTCDSYKDVRGEVKGKIIAALNSTAFFKLRDFPGFFDAAARHANTPDKAVRELEAFPPELAVRACLPVGLKGFLKTQYCGPPEKKQRDAAVRQALLDIQVPVLEAYMHSWRQHSKAFYDYHRPPPLPPSSVR